MSVQQDFDSNVPVQALIGLAVESWRFARAYLRLVDKLESADATRYANQHRYFLKQIEEQLQVLGLKLVDLEGHTFDVGMAATAINLPDFDPDDTLIVDQMLEPVIMGPEGLLKMGTVLLKKDEQQ